MSREIPDDFAKLVDFIKEYNLQTVASNREFLKILSQQHKKFYSYLTCVAELTELSKNTSLKPKIVKNQIAFITESCSDIGSTLFVMTHGAYKASKMMLRSSIETFLKGFTLDELTNINLEKSVFNIFDE